RLDESGEFGDQRRIAWRLVDWHVLPHPGVIPERPKALSGIHLLLQRWIPALRFAPAGMTVEAFYATLSFARRLRRFGSSAFLRRRMLLGVTSTSSSSPT